ncbi:hypothetical protein HanIR_Chr13g0624501 [Helianthus annuus]|nr:hypothetical protein HanIR_Chr13g0624501 [Helianthus annuus]
MVINDNSVTTLPDVSATFCCFTWLGCDRYGSNVNITLSTKKYLRPENVKNRYMKTTY